MFGIQFYPTPPDLVQKMIEKIDFEKVSYILEPSAGKGDIIEGFRKYRNEISKDYSYYEHQKGTKSKRKSFSTEKECVEYINQEHNKNFNSIKEVKSYFHDLEDENTEYEVQISDSNLSKKEFEIEAVEIDPSLQAILKDKKIKVVGNNFEEFNPCCRYDLILIV